MIACPICNTEGAAVSNVIYGPDPETGYRDCSTILDCPSCGTLIDGEIQYAIDALPAVPLVDTREEVVSCPF